MRRILEYKEAKQVVVSGDIHGDFKGIVYKLCIQYGLTDTLLIVAGDCGFGFEKQGYYKYMRIIGDAEVEDAINAVDPPGGPFLQVGSKVADKTIKEIRWNRDDDRFFLVLE